MEAISAAFANDTDPALIARYPFAGDARDHGPGGYHAVLAGALPTRDRHGTPGGALAFDGVQSMVHTEFDGLPRSDEPLAVAWWFLAADPQLTEFNAGNMIVLFGPRNGTQCGFRGPDYQTRGFDMWKHGGGTLLTMDPPAWDTWHHAVYSSDGTTHRFFLNGREVVSSTEPPQTGEVTKLWFGNFPNGGQFFKGALSDVRLYRRALTAVEAKFLFERE